MLTGAPSTSLATLTNSPEILDEVDALPPAELTPSSQDAGGHLQLCRIGPHAEAGRHVGSETHPEFTGATAAQEHADTILPREHPCPRRTEPPRSPGPWRPVARVCRQRISRRLGNSVKEPDLDRR